MSAPRVHDLLRVDPALAAGWDAPSWVHASLRHAPWVVVRRAASAPPQIAVGVRGATRRERFATVITARDVRERITPRMLAARCAANALGATARPGSFASRDVGNADAALSALAVEVAAAARAAGVDWGIAGSFGFALASGAMVTHAASDLDLVIELERAPGSDEPPSHTEIARLRPMVRALRALAVAHGRRIDAEALVASTGYALEELTADTNAPVLAKTAAGPRLITIADRVAMR